MGIQGNLTFRLKWKWQNRFSMAKTMLPSRIWLAGLEAVGGIQPSDHAAVVADIRMIAE